MNAWDGEALPFINLSHNYGSDPNIQMWNKVGSGDFGSIEDRDLINAGDINTMFFLIGWADGVEISKRKEADVKQEVGYIYDQRLDGSPVYLLSLKQSVISSRPASRRMHEPGRGSNSAQLRTSSSSRSIAGVRNV